MCCIIVVIFSIITRNSPVQIFSAPPMAVSSNNPAAILK